MKVVHVDTGKDWRGGQNQVFLLAKGLARLNIAQVLVCQKSGELARRAAGEGIETIEVSMSGECDPGALLRIRRILKRRGADICHCHDSHSHGLVFLATLGMRKLRIIVTRRVDFEISKNFFSREKYASHRVSFIAISDGVQRVLVEGEVDEERIFLVRSGIDLERFREKEDPGSLRAELEISEDAIVIGNVANLTDHKGHIYLVRAAPEILSRFPKAVFVIVGEGEERATLEREIEERGLGEHFRLPGFREDVGRFLRLFDVFVLSSHLEGLCTSLLDAMAVGVPIVATDTGGVPDVIIDGRNGLLAKMKNPASLARKTIRLLEDVGLQRECVAEGIRLVNEKFTADHMIEGTIRVYGNLMNK